MAGRYARGNSERCVWGVYVILDAAMAGRTHAEAAREALDGGARVLQLRDKTAPFERLLEVGRELRELTRARGATLIVNDNPYLAHEVDADGVHLGQSDFPAAIARDIVGPDRIIGLSTHTKLQALEATRQPVDYIGVGPVFATTSKRSEWKPLGIPHIRWVRENVSLPMVAIGGITMETLPDCVAAGADNVAMIAEIMRAESIAERVRRLAAQFEMVS